MAGDNISMRARRRNSADGGISSTAAQPAIRSSILSSRRSSTTTASSSSFALPRPTSSRGRLVSMIRKKLRNSDNNDSSVGGHGSSTTTLNDSFRSSCSNKSSCMKKSNSSSKKWKGLRWRPSLNRLLEQDDFEQIREILNGDGTGEQANNDDIVAWVEECSDFSGQTALHFTLKCHPPLDIIESIVDVLSSKSNVMLPEQACDCLGRTPLHVAAGWGAGSAVLTRLMKGGRSKRAFLAKTKDCQGRTPLHLACMNPSGKNLSSSSPAVDNSHEKDQHQKDDTSSINEEIEQDMIEVVKILLNADPVCLLACDSEGKTPMDYAIQENANEHMMTVLRNASEDVLGGGKSMKKSSSSSSIKNNHSSKTRRTLSTSITEQTSTTTGLSKNIKIVNKDQYINNLKHKQSTSTATSLMKTRRCSYKSCKSKEEINKKLQELFLDADDEIDSGNQNNHSNPEKSNNGTNNKNNNNNKSRSSNNNKEEKIVDCTPTEITFDSSWNCCIEDDDISDL